MPGLNLIHVSKRGPSCAIYKAVGRYIIKMKDTCCQFLMLCTECYVTKRNYEIKPYDKTAIENTPNNAKLCSN